MSGKKWKHKITGTDGNCILFGVNIFDYKWADTKEKIEILDPIYHQSHMMNIYTAEINGKIKRFAAAEFSNCMWGFYVEK